MPYRNTPPFSSLTLSSPSFEVQCSICSGPSQYLLTPIDLLAELLDAVSGVLLRCLSVFEKVSRKESKYGGPKIFSSSQRLSTAISLPVAPQMKIF